MVGLYGLIGGRRAITTLERMIAADESPVVVASGHDGDDRGGLALLYRPHDPAPALVRRGELIAAVVGHPYDDTRGITVGAPEVLDAYERDDPSLASGYLGDFAIAIVDLARGESILITDTLGLRPLFYWRDDRQFAFGSAVWPLARVPGFQMQLDFDGVACWWCFDFTVGESTLFKGVSKVPGGTILRFRRGAISMERYTQLPRDLNPRPVSDDELAERLDAAARNAVRKLLPPTSEVSTFLSGGYDSRWITAILAHGGYEFKAYNVAYNSAERDHATQVAKALQLDLVQIPVRQSLTDEYGVPLRWSAWGFPVRKHSPLIPVERYRLSGFVLDGLAGEWVRRANWNLDAGLRYGDAVPRLAYERFLAVPPAALFRASVASRIRERAIAQIARTMVGTEVADEHRYAYWSLRYRSPAYTANVHLQTLGWVESIHPFCAPEFLRLLFSSPLQQYTRRLYRRVFERFYPELAGIPHPDDVRITDDSTRGRSSFHWRQVPARLSQVWLGSRTSSALRRGGLTLRLVPLLVGTRRWEWVVEPLYKLSLLEQRLAQYGVEIDFRNA